MAKGRHNGSQKRRVNPQDEVNPKLAEVVQLHPLAQFQQQESLITFGQLKVGDKFKLPRTESSPKEECPVFIKTEITREDDSRPFSRLCNYKVGSHMDWFSEVIPVIPVF